MGHFCCMYINEDQVPQGNACDESQQCLTPEESERQEA